MISRKTTCKNGRVVETWRDRTYGIGRLVYITQTKDAEGNQIGDAEIDGDPKSARLSHDAAVRENGGPGTAEKRGRLVLHAEADDLPQLVSRVRSILRRLEAQL